MDRLWNTHDGGGVPSVIRDGVRFESRKLSGKTDVLTMGDRAYLQANPQSSSWHWNVPALDSVVAWRLIEEPRGEMETRAHRENMFRDLQNPRHRIDAPEGPTRQPERTT